MEDTLRFVALGGVGEIGLNCHLYGLDGHWLMVDLGIGFPEDGLPGAELLVPDITFARERRDDLLALVLTHAHEDHLGAVPYLWRDLGCPVICSRFAAAVLRRKFRDMRLDPPPIREVEPGEIFELGPFSCRFVHVTHSIPEANVLVLETRLGRVVHTGDWKLDPAPLIGDTTDVPTLEALGYAGVLAVVGDSTNILIPGTSGSEAEVRDSLARLIAQQPWRVAVTTFSSHIARLRSAALAGAEAGREVFVVGRSIRRMLEAAEECGYLQDMPRLRDESEVARFPRERVLMLVTGSQGEAGSALVRIAHGIHPRVRLEPGDTVIFSSRIIPGNERTLFDLHNRLVLAGIEVITEEDHFVHVSGHPSREEVEQLYRWLRPKVVVPVHGEPRHLHGHVHFARGMGIPHVPWLTNGQMLRLAPGDPEVVDTVPVGRRVVVNGEFLAEGDEVFRARRRLQHHGALFVSVVLDSYGSVLAPPVLSNAGAVPPESFEQRREQVADAVIGAVEALDDRAVLDDERVREAVRIAVRQGFGIGRDRRPIVDVAITRLTPEVLAALEEDGTGVR